MDDCYCGKYEYNKRNFDMNKVFDKGHYLIFVEIQWDNSAKSEMEFEWFTISTYSKTKIELYEHIQKEIHAVTEDL